MITVYLTKQEKRKLQKEAKVRGLTMSTLAAHKFLKKTEQELVFGNPPTGRTTRFGFSVSNTLKSQIEYGAFIYEVPTSQFMREIIVNN